MLKNIIIIKLFWSVTDLTISRQFTDWEAIHYVFKLSFFRFHRIVSFVDRFQHFRRLDCGSSSTGDSIRRRASAESLRSSPVWRLATSAAAATTTAATISTDGKDGKKLLQGERQKRQFRRRKSRSRRRKWRRHWQGRQRRRRRQSAGNSQERYPNSHHQRE